MNLRGVNRVILLGVVQTQPSRVSFTDRPGQRAAFLLKTTEEWVDKSTKETKSNSEYHHIVGKELISDDTSYAVNIGDTVYIEGRLHLYRSEDGAGNKSYQMQVIASVVEPQSHAELHPSAEDLAGISHDEDVPVYPSYDEPQYTRNTPSLNMDELLGSLDE